jgi:hypothetical protein
MFFLCFILWSFLQIQKLCHTSLGDIFTYKKCQRQAGIFYIKINYLAGFVAGASWIGDAGAAASVLSIILESVS